MISSGVTTRSNKRSITDTVVKKLMYKGGSSADE
ncbi:hypothetical protein PAECIP111802_04962 [Paenibacillus allorhizosphaerae]|uniref:Uncharacterized protein n=1 Tax=Paenibacillus allorhizosphaerae TaxID=2849866 RepID=A0ABM8VNI4_9BACL|nr:hypothetical protein PAECIP111802_04962 [Paenibacillus allorhizosphaerae]